MPVRLGDTAPDFTAESTHGTLRFHDMIHPNADDTTTVRSVFIVGPDNKVKLTQAYPDSTGRNFRELLRCIDSLQLVSAYSVSTPADWKPGEDVIIDGHVTDEEARAKFPRGSS